MYVLMKTDGHGDNRVIAVTNSKRDAKTWTDMGSYGEHYYEEHPQVSRSNYVDREALKRELYAIS